MRASKLKRKRERQRRRFSQRPQPEVTAKDAATPQVDRFKTADLISELARPISSRAFAEALQETQHT
jgi:hypothetical protein